MNVFRPTLLLTAMFASSAWAQSDPGMVGLCHDSSTQDRQPNFATLNLKDLASVLLTADVPPALRLNTNLEVLNPERIYFPFAQQVRVSYLYESADNSAALGYFYYKDLVDRGYINQAGTPDDTSDDSLADNDGDGIMDFHEDLFRMSKDPTNKVSSYDRRCTNQFEYTYGSKKTWMYIPELASGNCGDYIARNQSVTNASMVLPGTRGSITVDLVGQQGSAGNADQFGDKGLYRSVPNLLEPRDPKNNLQGIGHLIFLHSDDDDNRSTGANLGPVPDDSTISNGIPDYNVSGFDTDGRPLASPPDNDLEQENDRTVNLGEIQGEREIVLFVIGWGGAGHNPSDNAGGTVYPCLGFKPGLNNECALHLKAPTNVYFSKTFLNLDQNSVRPTATTVDGKLVASVAERNIGCAYGSSCPDEANRSLPGWLDAATLNRLKTVSAYNNLIMPKERAVVKADTSRRNMMPHVLVGAPSTDKYRWVLGFEDLPGGGDRDFNDVSFMVHKSNGGKVRSAVVSGDLSPTISQDYTITEVTFGAEDEAFYSANNSSFCKDRPAEDRPRIRYQVALDCQVCKTGTCNTPAQVMVPNPTPTWVDVPLADPDAAGKRYDKNTVTLRDFLERGLTGSQLCWQSIMESKYDDCQPTIRNINVFYKAVKAGDYGRAAVTPMANAVLYGTFETPGRSWFNETVKPSVRVVDGKADLTERGHFYLKQLFVPETPTVTTGTELWDSGRKLANSLQSSGDPAGWRKLITTDPTGKRAELKNLLTDANGGEAFSSANCGANNGGDWTCDLDSSGGPPDNSDRALLRNWLYGWENRTGTNSGVKRTWSMGGIQLSTPAYIGPAGIPAWLRTASIDEQGSYIAQFQSDDRVKKRPAVAYMGTTQGFLHAVDVGYYELDNDKCTDATEANGYFRVRGTNCTPPLVREYGEGSEKFAYMPRKLLPYYVASYLRTGNGKRASVDASPSVANVDLGFGTYNPVSGTSTGGTQKPWTIGTKGAEKATEGAKTVLVSATGPSHSVIFSLDVTDPTSTTFPLPMWEFDMAADKVDFGQPKGALTMEDAFADLGPAGTLLPDTRGSRHSPPLVRMNFGGGSQRWVSVVGTDYVPNPGTAGTLYLLDMKTGMPVQVQSGKSAGKVAGVIPLAKDEGIAGEPSAVDVDQDGNSELIYVSTTKGKVFRIATDKTPEASKQNFGTMFQVCKIADVQEVLTASTKPGYSAEAKYQGVYSSMAVQRVSNSVVRVYVGTGNNPDSSTEDVDLLATPPHGYVLSFEDKAPRSDTCTTASTLWLKQLDVGQSIWGGLVLGKDSSLDPNKPETINTTTAAGKAATACSLSATQTGMLYSISTSNPDLTKRMELGGQSLAAPVMYDGHMIMLTADGHVVVQGDPKKWNNPPESTLPGNVRIKMWDADPSGAVKP